MLSGRRTSPLPRVGRWIAVSIAAGLAVAACGGGSSANSSGGPIRLGMIESFGGILAPNGLAQVNGINFFIDQVNAKGGLHGRKLEIVKRDDNSDPATGVQQIRDLINDPSVVGVVGPTGSGVVAAAKPVAEEAGITLVSSVSAAALSDPPRQWWFRSIPADVLQTQAIMNFISKKGAKTAVIVHADDAFGQSGAANFQKYAANFGLSIVDNISYPGNTTDPTVQIIKAKNSNADAYIIWDGSSSARLALAVKTARQQGITNKIIALPEAAAADAFIQAAGDAGNGCYFFSLMASEDPMSGPQKDFVEGYRAKHGSLPDDNVLLGYAAITMLAKGVDVALASGKKLDRTSVRDAMEQIRNFPTAIGTVNYSSKSHDPIGLTEVEVNVVQNGKRVRTT